MRQRGSLLLDVGVDGLSVLTASAARIVLAKPAGSGAPNVAWLAFEPQHRLTIEWDDLYGVFASESGVRAGSRIEVASCIYPAEARRIYSFDGLRFAEGRPDGRVPVGHYDVWNAGPSPATFGLLQHARIDGALVPAPLNAIVLATDLTADFSPDERIYLWTQRGTATGDVIDGVPADAAVAIFDRKERVRSYRFDLRSLRFISST